MTIQKMFIRFRHNYTSNQFPWSGGLLPGKPAKDGASSSSFLLPPGEGASSPLPQFFIYNDFKFFIKS